AVVNEIVEISDASFALDTIRSNIPILSDDPITLSIPGIPNVNFTFTHDFTFTRDSGTQINWDISIQNLTGNDLTPRDIPINSWIITNVRDSGDLYGYTNYCRSEEGNDLAFRIPPGYTDTLRCS